MRFTGERKTTADRPAVSITTATAVCLALTAGAMQSSHVAASAQSAAARAWRPSVCPPPAQVGSGPSNVKVTGPCAFEHKGEAVCNAEGDDFLVSVVRPAKGSAELMLYINVERYVGPRTYKPPNDMFVSVKDGSKIYRWSTTEYEATVGPGSKSVRFKNVRLEPEPVLIGCTGPQDNYQCDGRGEEDGMMSTIATVSGTIVCKPGRTR